MKKFLSVFLAVALVSSFTLSACSEEEDAAQENSRLFVEVENGEMERFDSLELELVSGVGKVEWTSSNEDVVEIDDGVLVGISAGTATISATYNGKTQEQYITVVDNGKTPDFDVEYLPLILGDSYTLQMNAYFKGEKMTETSFTYSVKDTNVATLTDNVLTAKAYGETTVDISLTWQGKKVCTKSVPCSVLENIAVYTDKAEYTLYTLPSVVGETFATCMQIQPTVYYEDELVDGLQFTWKSLDENVATVDENGVVSAVSVGKTYVVGECSHDGKTLSTRQIPVSVNVPHVETSKAYAFDIANGVATFDAEEMLGEGYKIGKIVDVASGSTYEITDNTLSLAQFGTGRYSLAIYEENDAFSLGVKVVVADYLVRTKGDLQVATAATSGYIALCNDLTDVGEFTTTNSTSEMQFNGTFDGLGHTISGIVYPTANCALFSHVFNATIKNLAVKCTIANANQGALFYVLWNVLTVENCYLETTISDAFVKNSCGGVGGYIAKNGGLWLKNTIIKVNGLDQNDYVQTNGGAIAGRIASMNVTYENSYVIAKGALYSKTNDKNNSTYKEMNMNSDMLFEDEEGFAAAKAAGEISFDGYNEYWNLTGIVPEFH